MKLYTMILLLVLSIIKFSAAYADDASIVTLPEGQIRGQELRSADDNVYYAFQEIPYAAAPIGELRFRAPVSPEPWGDILNATQNTKICFQSETIYKPENVTETEDCLYFNVYTPLQPGDSAIAPLPVLVWIHGGAFLNGAGIFQMYNPKFFMDHQIVVVTLNYRLGALGFLTTEDGIIPGNIGLKDQHFAIQWVKKNIHLFAGDPDKIVISGESAGGVSVGFHLISPSNKDLFWGAILESGTPLIQRTHQNYARFYAFELGKSLDANFTSDDSEDLLKLLQSLPASDINDNTITADIGKETGLFEGQGLIWLPVIEDSGLEEAFLTGLFHEDIRTGNINQVPTLIGFNSEEEIFFMFLDPSLPMQYAKYFDNDLSNLIRNKFNMTDANKLTASTKLKEIYTSGSFQEDVGSVIKFISDESFSTPTTRHAKLQSNYTDVFLYQFSYKGKMGGLPGVEIEGVTGVGHAEELGYLWDTRLTVDDTPDDPEDLIVRQRLLTLWSNFVKYLNPTPEEDSSLDNIIWETVTPKNLVYLNINSTLNLQQNPKQYLEWENIIDTYAIPPLVNY